ncbi:hypothetical protein BDB01DRAFT_788149 [Pilobolus umbonatus]|nr:hypothetical protein BDB01DRAFT_788149 [Pilobolus umbonatus]
MRHRNTRDRSISRSQNDNTPEYTPLLKPLRNRLTTKKRSLLLYGTSLFSLFAFSILISWYRNILPTALSDFEAKKYDDFSGLHAYNEYLSHFTTPHSVNSRENGVIRDWLLSLAKDFQAEASEKGVQVDVISPQTTDIVSSNWTGGGNYWVVEARNVIIRLHGTSGKEDSLLINAHYDSVPTSNGVTDNGMGVSTQLELLRYFIHHPPKHTIVFLFNNFEEGGLIGAESFVKHPWFSSAKLFINLEGAGAGGRSMIFRCSNLNAMKLVSNSEAAYMHSTPLGNDLLKLQLIKSDTDYTVFTQHHLPGIDLAFYSPRSHYHTPRDNLAYTTPNALQYMGQFALASARAIADSDELTNLDKEQESLIYYDILGRVMFVYSFTVYQMLNAFGVLAVLITSFWLMIDQKQDNISLGTLIKDRIVILFRGILSVLSAFIISVLFAVAAGYVMAELNPFVTYGNIYGAFIYLAAAVFLGLQVSQYILPNGFKQYLYVTHAPWYGLVSFWALAVLLSCWTGSKGIAILYFAIYFLVFNALAILCHIKFPHTMKFRLPLIFTIQMLVPFILMIENTFLIMDAMRHTTTDGTPELAVYILLAIPLVFTLLNYLPWIYLAGHQSEATITSVGVFIFLFIVCSILQPFNGKESPNKVLYRQDYNVSDNFSTITVTSDNNLYSLLSASLPKESTDTLHCNMLNSHRTTCRYQSKLLPLYAGNSTLNEFVLSGLEKNCEGSLCITSGSYTSKNSLMCSTSFESTGHVGIHRVWINDQLVEGNNISYVLSYVDHYEQPVLFRFEYPSDTAHRAYFHCLYDEWVHQELPAFTYFRNNLPEDTIIAIRGQGLAHVHYDIVEL